LNGQVNILFFSFLFFSFLFFSFLSMNITTAYNSLSFF